MGKLGKLERQRIRLDKIVRQVKALRWENENRKLKSELEKAMRGV